MSLSQAMGQVSPIIQIHHTCSILFLVIVVVIYTSITRIDPPDKSLQLDILKHIDLQRYFTGRVLRFPKCFIACLHFILTSGPKYHISGV